MEPDDLLCSHNARPPNDGQGATGCPSCSQNARDKNVLVRCALVNGILGHSFHEEEECWKALAWADGTSRRASGWAGEMAVRSRRSLSPHP
jgi:hypothetical protein